MKAENVTIAKRKRLIKMLEIACKAVGMVEDIDYYVGDTIDSNTQRERHELTWRRVGEHLYSALQWERRQLEKQLAAPPKPRKIKVRTLTMTFTEGAE